MTGTSEAVDTTVDAFLGGKLEAVQPRKGHHRSGLEAVLLGAALPAHSDGLAVDLGAGAGVAGLCLAARCPQLRVLLVEREAELAGCARQSLSLEINRQVAERVSIAEVDITCPEEERAAAGFTREMADFVVTNPPFHLAGTVRPSPDAGRAAAHVLAAGLDFWFRAAAFALVPGGSVVAVLTASVLDGLITAASGRFGGLTILPLHPRPGVPAERLLVRAWKGSRASPTILPGLTLHGPDGSAFAAPVSAILREGAGLAEVHPAWVARG